MADINSTILNGMYQIYAPHGVTSVSGTYDGIDMVLSMVWPDDTISDTFKFKWVIGMSTENFVERVMNNFGILVSTYNARYTVPAFDAFMAEVTE